MMQAPVGVVAKTLAQANDLIRALGLDGAQALSTRPDSIDGLRLRAVIVDSSALPLTAEYEAVLRSNLLKTPGSGGLYELRLR
ncbi:hypothetical protein ORI20_13960 [Mycobacterium sp. CVI_P3]|uniref:Uncharacterized protein n=1 Tax=Mycobacterium pinniadriaticum TaxID=2994102 RepID=A0ABT3SFA9_9MYCO|nr:hypothetical protein [Mycobacterium pinniadriaticum]MCX2931385.1 hypothetical protein [Mycobacterium pinniadriaticum]MCX2937809.1 hypothetical protein [Mycobacterium pinniadriaticum]